MCVPITFIVFTLSANSYRFCLQLDFLLFILLIANCGNYLRLRIVVHYKTECSNNILSENYNCNNNHTLVSGVSYTVFTLIYISNNTFSVCC